MLHSTVTTSLHRERERGEIDATQASSGVLHDKPTERRTGIRAKRKGQEEHISRAKKTCAKIKRGFQNACFAEEISITCVSVHRQQASFFFESKGKEGDTERQRGVERKGEKGGESLEKTVGWSSEIQKHLAASLYFTGLRQEKSTGCVPACVRAHMHAPR